MFLEQYRDQTSLELMWDRFKNTFIITTPNHSVLYNL